MSQISSKLSQQLARIQEKIPEQKVGLVPSDAFFTRKVDLPGGLSQEERAAFIQLYLEGNSPFPMEQLAWGFLQWTDSTHALVYATPKSRLKRLEFEKIERYHQLFPGFITLFGETTASPTIRFVCQNGVLSALYMPAGNPVPEKIIARKVSGDLLTDDALLEAREKLEQTLSTEGYSLEDGLWLGEGLTILPNGSPQFMHRHLSTRESLGLKALTLSLDDTSIWEADLRDQAFSSVQGLVRKRSSLIWTSLRVGAWAAAILLVFQLFNFGLSFFNVLRENKIDELEPQAVRVENKLTLAERLTQSTEEDLKPFLLMEAINAFRPDSIFYGKVRSRAFNELEIEGESTEGVTPVNAFADSIGQLPFVKSVENNSQTRNNQTSFELLITFSEMPPAPEGGFIIPSANEESTDESTEENG